MKKYPESTNGRKQKRKRIYTYDRYKDYNTILKEL